MYVTGVEDAKTLYVGCLWRTTPGKRDLPERKSSPGKVFRDRIDQSTASESGTLFSCKETGCFETYPFNEGVVVGEKVIRSVRLIGPKTEICRGPLSVLGTDPLRSF